MSAVSSEPGASVLARRQEEYVVIIYIDLLTFVETYDMRSPIDKSATPSEKLDFIFAHICNFENTTTGRRNDEGGVAIDFRAAYMSFDHNYFGLNSYEEMNFYLDTLKQKGLIMLFKDTPASRLGSGQKIISFYSSGVITFLGLKYLSQISKKGVLSNQCFVAMVFDEKKDQRLAAIQAACLPMGFDAFVIDQFASKENQTIDAKIIAAIKSSRFCIADFTSLNLGAYFEAGIAVGREMKVIFICESKDFRENKKHFDVNHYPFLCYDGFTHLTQLLTDEIGAYIA
jgi:hypothetical protein